MAIDQRPASAETARHDHEAGRQLAAVCVFAGLAAAGIVVYVDASLQCVFCTLAFLALGVLGVLWPIGAIRLVSGRFSELGDTTVSQPSTDAGDAPDTAGASASSTTSKGANPAATAPAIDPTSESLLEKTQSGIPIGVGLAEDALKSKGRRAWVGIAAMILGVIVFAASGAFKTTHSEAATRIAQLGVALAFGGLVLWYRTK